MTTGQSDSVLGVTLMFQWEQRRSDTCLEVLEGLLVAQHSFGDGRLGFPRK